MNEKNFNAAFPCMHFKDFLWIAGDFKDDYKHLEAYLNTKNMQFIEKHNEEIEWKMPKFFKNYNQDDKNDLLIQIAG